MSLPRVLVLGIPLFVDCANSYWVLPNILALIFPLRILLLSKGTVLGGRTVTKTVQLDLDVIKSFKPDIVIIQLGSYDLTSETALRVGSSTDIFVKLLHDLYHVKVIYLCQTIMRLGQSAFNRKVKLLTKYLRVVLEPVPSAHFWGHRGFWRPSNNVYVRDGVHLNLGGQGKFYRSLRGAILGALSLLTVFTG